jgi:prepilin-type N-terminal cleavage/methylation domain-containing protein
MKTAFTCRHSVRGGFTLLEILLATGIFAIVLIAINTVFFAGLHLRKRTTEAIEDSLPLNRALSVLKKDLQNAVPPGGHMAGFFRAGVSGGSTFTSGVASGVNGTTFSGANLNLPGAMQGGTLDFYTATGQLSDYEPWSEIQQVSYLLVEPSESASSFGRDLVRVANRNLLTLVSQVPETERLLPNVEYLELEFFDGAEWRLVWDTTSTDTELPQAVRVRLLPAVDPVRETARREPIEMVVLIAPRSSAGTNASLEVAQ